MHFSLLHPLVEFSHGRVHDGQDEDFGFAMLGSCGVIPSDVLHCIDQDGRSYGFAIESVKRRLKAWVGNDAKNVTDTLQPGVFDAKRFGHDLRDYATKKFLGEIGLINVFGHRAESLQAAYADFFPGFPPFLPQHRPEIIAQTCERNGEMERAQHLRDEVIPYLRQKEAGGQVALPPFLGPPDGPAI